jgi:hypothetical protein
MPNHAPFNALPLKTDINQVNVKTGYWQQKSEGFDFSKEDQINEREFSEVIWKAIKGEKSELPSPKRASFVKNLDFDL